MKKALAFVAGLAVAASAFAIDFSLGLRGNVNFGLGTTLSDDEKEGFDTAKKIAEAAGADVYDGGGVYGGFGVYGNIGIVSTDAIILGIQPEFDFNFNGYWFNVDGTIEGESYTSKTDIGSFTLDIPVLVTLDLPLADVFSLGFGLGPQLSIPLVVGAVTELNGKVVNDHLEYTSTGANFGMVFDVNGKLHLGEARKFALVLDVRYNLDFTPTKAKITYDYDGSSYVLKDKQELFTRRALNVGLGCEFKF